MKVKSFLVGLAALTVIFLPSFVSAGVPEAVTYLQSQTQDAWTTMALAAAGQTGMPTAHLTSVSGDLANDYAKAILALTAAGQNPTTFGNIDYIAKLKSYYNNNQMGDVSLLNDDIWSILALASVYQADSNEAIAAKNFLIANQNVDGGWGYNVGGASDTNDTSAAIMALMEVGVSASDSIIAKAVVYLRSAQNNDGGFTYDPGSLWGTDSDSGSDAWVISALYKIGQDPASWAKGTSSPLTNLRSLQDSDGGFWWIAGESEYNNKTMTPYAVIALSSKSFPVGYYHIPPPTRLTADRSTLNYGENLTIKVEYFNGQSWLGLEGAIVKGGDQDYITDSSGQVVKILPTGNYTLFAKKDGFVSSDEIGVIVSTPISSGGGSVAPDPLVEDQKKNDNIPEEVKEIKNKNETEKVLGVKVADPDFSQPIENIINADPIDFSNIELIMADIGERRNLVEEKEGVNRYTKPLVKDIEGLNGGQINAVTNFVVYGVKNTQKLGAGERAGVLNSYKSSFGKLPITQDEWEDAIKISNNTLPGKINLKAEDKARIDFKKIYQREADANNASDKTAIDIIAYGLRPRERNLDLERAGIGVFIEIYGYLPTLARDWDIVRAFAYSGAIK